MCPAPRPYGSSNPSFPYTSDATVYGLGIAGALSCATAEGVTKGVSPSLPAGGYSIAPTDCTGLSLTGPGASIDSIAYTGTFTVFPAPITISASTASFTYGGAVPEITPSYSGFVDNEGASFAQPGSRLLDDGHQFVASWHVPVDLLWSGGRQLRHRK
jgi:hypothetical protein